MTEHESNNDRTARRNRTPSWGFALAGGAAYLLLGVLLWWALDQYIKPGDSTERKDLVQALALIMAGVAGAGGVYFTWRGQRITQEDQKENQQYTLQQLEQARGQLQLAQKSQEENQKNTLAQLENAREQLELARQSQAENQKNTQAQMEQSRDELAVSREGQITERFTKAIEQIGATSKEGKNLEMRLGGIHALERIAEEAANIYHWPIMQIFTAYLRTHAPWQGSRIIEPEEDIQTILRVIGGRASHGEPERLLLSSTDFSRYDLSDAHLENAVFVSTSFESAHLGGAHLQGADLSGARLQGANLTKADLRGAMLRGAHLEGAYLVGADLRGADLADVHLARTDVQVADLRGVQNFDPQSLDQANGHWNTENKEDNTKVGEAPRPAWWSNLPKDGDLLVAGDYSIKVCETPLHFHVGEGWHSLLFLPHGFSLSLTGSVAHTGFPSRTSSANVSGPLLSFRSEKYVCDPRKPKEPGVLQPAPMDMEGMVDWYTNHPYLDTTEPDNCEIGGAPGKQFNAEIYAGKEHELLVNAPHFDRAALPLFPGAPRDAPFVLFPQIRNRIIVLELKHETMVIILESSPAEFGSFYEHVADVLATISWNVMPSR